MRHARRVGLAFLLVLGVSAVASAQETYSLGINAAQATDLRTYVLGVNRDTCRKYGLAATCTQAQACTVAGAAGGASCTAAQARNVNARIYPDTVPGREEFVTSVWVVSNIVDARRLARQQQGGELCAAWRTATTAAKNTVCSTMGLGAGCEVCPE